jgi:pimeloyl-ACP methyl ester carboxylesterase
MPGSPERLLLGALALAGLGYLLFGLWLYLNQSRMIYYPGFAPPRDDIGTELFSIDGEAIRVHVMNPGRRKAVLYFGGNAEAVGYSAERLAQALPGKTLYLVNYRGYGGSTGKPEERALYGDALQIFDAIRPRHESIAVIGRSLGSGVATWLAVERRIDRLVLVTPFDSLAGIAGAAFPLYPAGLLLRERYASAERAPRIDTETLILAAGDDSIVPEDSTRKLAGAFVQGNARVVTIPGAGHNSLSEKRDYYRQLTDFLIRDQSKTDD